MQIGQLGEYFYKDDSEREAAALYYLDSIIPYMPDTGLFEVSRLLVDYSKTFTDKKLEFKKVIEIQTLVEEKLKEYGFITKDNPDDYRYKLTETGRDLKVKGGLQRYLHSVNEKKELSTKLIREQIKDIPINKWNRQRTFILGVILLCATIVGIILGKGCSS
jgi:hypothetical protein